MTKGIRVIALSSDGTERGIEAESIRIELDRRRHVTLLTSDPLHLRCDAVGEGEFAVFVIRAGAGNTLHVAVELHPKHVVPD